MKNLLLRFAWHLKCIKHGSISVFLLILFNNSFEHTNEIFWPYIGFIPKIGNHCLLILHWVAAVIDVIIVFTTSGHVHADDRHNCYRHLSVRLRISRTFKTRHHGRRRRVQAWLLTSRERRPPIGRFYDRAFLTLRNRCHAVNQFLERGLVLFSYVVTWVYWRLTMEMRSRNFDARLNKFEVSFCIEV